MKKKRYRVYIGQVNQTYVDVSATGEEEARETGYQQWRKEEAHSYVLSVEELSIPNHL